ncbi:conserved exported hypothetical protein [uncultured delta proteobacterium]|uniref:Tripartite tricarboxylate transporter substrate binding protein n=1 Tax=uncultured delta proteobacterium TaxID=34034 RepID=A0A212JMI6_9DELT|nr:conserved exported hypothetical protein [uncultured delta proteobacterium]
MRKGLVLLAVVYMVAGMFAGAASAAEKPKDFPTRPITFIVPFNPGGSSGLMANKIGEYAEEYLGQPLNIVYRPGVGGLTATAEFAHAKKDGYTVLLAPNAVFTVQPFMRDVKYSINDYRILCGVHKDPQLIVVRYDAPYNTIKEMAEYFKKAGRPLKFGSSGTGGMNYNNQVLLYKRAGIEAQSVPFSGGAEPLINVLGGHIDIATGGTPEVFNYIREKQMKPLGLLAEERDTSDLYKDVPTFKELGYGDPLMIYKFLCVPAGTPEDRAAFLEDAFIKILRDKRWIEFSEKNYNVMFDATGKDITARIVPEIEETHKILKELGVAKK